MAIRIDAGFLLAGDLGFVTQFLNTFATVFFGELFDDGDVPLAFWHASGIRWAHTCTCRFRNVCIFQRIYHAVAKLWKTGEMVKFFFPKMIKGVIFLCFEMHCFNSSERRWGHLIIYRYKQDLQVLQIRQKRTPKYHLSETSVTLKRYTGNT